MATNDRRKKPASKNISTLIITDSRGKGLLPLIEQYSPKETNIDYNDLVIPGATLGAIHKRIERAIRRRSAWDAIIVIGGICNFTRRITSKNRRQLYYSERKLELVREEIDSLLQSLGRKVSVATITPASISKYSTHRDPETDPSVQEEQDNLVEDINQINRHVIETNKNRDLPTIDLACNSFTNKLKRQGSSKKRITKFTDKGLDDGLHPATN